MKRWPFRLLNVFAPTPLGGNPLAVFEDGRGLDDATMQALALQFNLSEITFVLPSSRVGHTARRSSSSGRARSSSFAFRATLPPAARKRHRRS